MSVSGASLVVSCPKDSSKGGSRISKSSLSLLGSESLETKGVRVTLPNRQPILKVKRTAPPHKWTALWRWLLSDELPSEAGLANQRKRKDLSNAGNRRGRPENTLAEEKMGSKSEKPEGGFSEKS